MNEEKRCWDWYGMSRRELIILTEYFIRRHAVTFSMNGPWPQRLADAAYCLDSPN